MIFKAAHGGGRDLAGRIRLPPGRTWGGPTKEETRYPIGKQIKKPGHTKRAKRGGGYVYTHIYIYIHIYIVGPIAPDGKGCLGSVDRGGLSQPW